MSLKRDVLDFSLPTDEVAAALRDVEKIEAFVFSESEANERLWGDALDLLRSATLSDEQRAFLFEVLETELGVTYAIVDAGVDVVETIEVRWDGHSANEPWSLYLDTASGAPVLFVIGDVNGSEDLIAVTDYTVDRVSTVDLGLASAATTEDSGEAAVAIDGDGLLSIDPADGSSILVPCGSARRDVIELVVPSYGPPGGETLLEECGGGPLAAVSWGGLTLYFEPDAANPEVAAFLGWVVDGADPVVTTVDGLRYGVPLVMVASRNGDVIADSTLGWEYFDGSTTFVSTGSAGENLVDVIWAGESCVFR